MADIKDSKELIAGANEIALFVIGRAKDGLDLSDGIAFYEALMTDVNFKNKIVAAYEGISNIPAEVKDLSVGEVVELAALQLSYVPKYVEILHG